MKNHKNFKYTFLTILAIVGLNACQKIDDLEPIYSLPAETAIANEATSEIALIGIYAGFGSNSGSGNPEIYMMPSLLSGLAVPGFAAFDDEGFGLAENQPIATGSSVTRGAYTRMFDIVNRCNWLIKEIADLSENSFSSPTRKSEIIAEAKAARATANFYLLRLWGQFYDMNSTFGIPIRTKPTTDATALPRNTVAESYAAILSDLDDAIANAPDLKTKYFVNKTFAKAAKARVLLYQGNYSQAASLAQEVINTGGDFALSPTFLEIFDNTNDALFSASELIFGSRGIKPEEEIGMGSEWGNYVEISPDYISLAQSTMTVGMQDITYDNGDRVANQLNIFNGSAKYAEFIPSFGENYELIYHFRMAELYLIVAEAEARANNAVTDNALAALNTIRTRAGAMTTGESGYETYPPAITYEQFLEAVRIEKWMEIGAEIGEEWFDLVRYDFADGFGTGFQVSDVKPAATNPDKFILPIPTESIQAGGNVVVQNPSY